MKKNKRLKIGLVLGGGGPRGLAHIGVIKVLKENNIPIDFIAGTSIGAMIGGFYAHTMDIKKVEEIALGMDHRLMFSLLDPSLGGGLFGGNKVESFIEKNLENINFESLKIPLSVVATNFKNGDAVIINNGNLSTAIIASISLPLVFKPVKRGNKLLVDGGLSLPVPVDVVKEMGADFVIAVNLNADFFSDNNKLADKIGLYKIAESSINLLQHNLSYQNVRNADIVINPRVGKTSWKKFLDGKDVILEGEKATRKIILQLKELMNERNDANSKLHIDVLAKIKELFK
ncbi:MAG: patatin-like phospholipase family protein [bacterium]